MTQPRLILFITGRSMRSLRAIKNFRQLGTKQFADCQTEIVDILDNPQQAEDMNILATPVLIKVSPSPARRIVGDLDDHDAVILGLDITTEE